MASKAMVAPVAASASVSSSMKLGDAVMHTCLAPCSRSSAACSGLRTMFTSAMPSFRQMRLSICPRFDAAAVCTSARVAFALHRLDHAQRGERVDEAGGAVGRGGVGAAAAGTGRPAMQRYCAYIAPPMIATVLPSSACAAGEAPALTTVPAPSLPTGSDWSARPAMAFMNLSGMRALSHRALGRARHLHRAHVGGAEQQAQVGGVDRRGLDAHQHLVGGRLGNRHVVQRDFEFAAAAHQRAQLKGSVDGVVGHGESPS